MVYEYINHTADIQVRVVAETFESALNDCVQAFTGVLTSQAINQVHAHTIEISANTKELLLFRLLDELVFLLDTQGFVGCVLQADVLDLGSQWVLDGVVYGDDISCYDHSGDIKAPTMHNLSVKQNASWECVYVLDL